MNKTVGIIGGIGPLATADLFRKMILMTDAKTDQEHLHIIVDNDTSVPDRTEALLRGGEDPTPYLVRSARRLQRAGAGVLAMPCCTGHGFLPAIESAVSVPVLNMLEETAETLAGAGVRRAGLLATEGMLATGLFDAALRDAGVEPLRPDESGQRAVTDMIYRAVKAGDWSFDTSGFRAMGDRLLRAGAEVLVLGCTELPVAFEEFGIDLPYADPTAILACAAVRAAGAKAAEGKITQYKLYCIKEGNQNGH